MSFKDYLLENKLMIDKNDPNTSWKSYPVLVNHWCHKVVLTIAQVALVVMLCTVFMNVILRFCFNSGIEWAEEVPSLLVTYFTMLACAIGVRDHLHISVTIIYSRFAKGGVVRKVMDILVDVATLVCGIMLFYYGMRQVTLLMGRPGMLPMTGWPTWIQYICFPIGGFLMTFDSILFLLGILDPDDLLYSEKEIDYQELLKQQQAEAAAEGGNN